MLTALIIGAIPILSIFMAMALLPLCVIKTSKEHHDNCWMAYCLALWKMPSGIGAFYGACIGLLAIGYSLSLSAYISAESSRQREIEQSKRVAATLQGEIANIRIFANEVVCLLTYNDTDSKIPYPNPELWKIYSDQIHTLKPDAILAVTSFYGLYQKQLNGEHRTPHPGETLGEIKAGIASGLVEGANITIKELAKISGHMPAEPRNCFRRK